MKRAHPVERRTVKLDAPRPTPVLVPLPMTVPEESFAALSDELGLEPRREACPACRRISARAAERCGHFVLRH
jgi:hypothetical protein